jgi:putative Holliday junction resolvase
MRILGVDVGARRIGLAISDPSATLARPLTTLHVKNDVDAIAQVRTMIAALAAEDDGLGGVVVGVPARLDGTDTDETARARRLIDALAGAGVPVSAEGERLTSREAEQRLARREKDWRRRKAAIDAAAAAIILQDYLDRSR